VTNVCTIVEGSGTLNVRPPHACVRRGSGIVVDIERYKIYYFTTKSMTVFWRGRQPAASRAMHRRAAAGSSHWQACQWQLLCDAGMQRRTMKGTLAQMAL
jgi:hypothetical protein